MNKPRARSPAARPLAVLTSKLLSDAFAKQGFASMELVTRWREIAGPEIAAHSELIKIQWRRMPDGEPAEPATLVLRVEGPAAIEIQHQSKTILESVNRFFGWQAVGKLALRQAPLSRRGRKPRAKIDAAEAARVAATLTEVDDERLRTALARLGAAVKRT